MPDTPKRSPFLRFDISVLPQKDLAKARDNLSAVVLQGEHLWLGGDEGTSIDRMTKDASGARLQGDATGNLLTEALK